MWKARELPCCGAFNLSSMNSVLSRRAVAALTILTCVWPALAANTIQVENALSGTSAWQLSNPATNREIEGYASLTSVNSGGQIAFFVNTAGPAYQIEIFR